MYEGNHLLENLIYTHAVQTQTPEAYLEASQTSMMELFCENSYSVCKGM